MLKFYFYSIKCKKCYDANPRIGGQILTNTDRYQYRIGEESSTNQWQTANTTVENGLAVATIQVPVNGMVYARYFDGTETSKAIDNIDLTPPSTAEISSSDIAQTSFKLNATGADDKGIKQYNFYINGAFKETVTTTGTTASITVTATAGTTYNNCYVIVQVQAGNMTTSNTISVTTEVAGVTPNEVAVVGDFVNYSVEVDGVTYDKWRILNFDNNGHMEIVCYNGPAFTLGAGLGKTTDTTIIGEAKGDFSTAIQQLNTASAPYKNGAYGYSARHLGSQYQGI